MTIILGHCIIKRQRGQRISPPETDPNPNRARTVAGLFRDVGTEMNSRAFSSWEPLLLLGVPSWGFTFVPRKTEKLEI